ncbi:EKC/KEOPS complex subunit LAGE3 [Sorex fumeus]|uniref:EKC/KEOPS complex subunit LAGE3 n=1 Tax=Sorex fumeus TaxID=62283 RepID=UPI0024AD0D8F|nr:EKC/KEOPS complex subunit LAGE3 [Sorex fumeus]
MHARAAESDPGGAGESADGPFADALMPQHARPSGDAEPAADGPRDHRHTFVLRVPFPAPLDAQIALGALAPDGEPHRLAVEKDLHVEGSVLTVRWRAGSTRVLKVSILTFLDQLCLVLRTLQRFGPAAPLPESGHR